MFSISQILGGGVGQSCRSLLFRGIQNLFLFYSAFCYNVDNFIQLLVHPRFSLSPVSICGSFGVPYRDQTFFHGIETSSMFLKVSSVSGGK